MHGDLLDIVVVIACVMWGVTGYHQGFLAGALSFIGLLGGGAVGVKVAPAVAQRWLPQFNHAIVGLVVVFVAAAIGLALASMLGGLIRSRLTWRPARLLDSLGGAAVSILAVLLVAWTLGSAVAHSSLTTLARQVRHSEVLTTLDQVMPEGAHLWFSSFRRLLDNYGFPQVFGGLGPQPIPSVPAPNSAVLANAAVQAAERVVVKVSGNASSCSRSLEGSGFVFAPQHVMTNAHVVAGVRAPVVRVGGTGPALPATVVLYDPERDVAVLYVPGLALSPLSFAGPAAVGANAVVAGYPENGPFLAVPARVRGVQEARGPDIYQQNQVTRQIYAIRAVVRPGNSGGPLLSPNGRVYGVVFAAAVDSPDTGYALTAAEVGPDARAGAQATAPVSTQGCD